ncbi:MAG TPA: TM2 domain-containing protein [Saprospiraceae bacterium]|nr:TM2 domain-containing protein [Saprospiraceae bacterium]
MKCNATLSSTGGTGEKNKLATVLLGVIFGGLGLHKFYLGYVKEGMIMLILAIVAGVITGGVFTLIMMVIGLIEGIIYLAKTDEEFNRIYVLGKRGWF